MVKRRMTTARTFRVVSLGKFGIPSSTFEVLMLSAYLRECSYGQCFALFLLVAKSVRNVKVS